MDQLQYVYIGENALMAASASWHIAHDSNNLVAQIHRPNKQIR
jgi:hypothetical protein